MIMGVKYKTSINRLPEVAKTMEALNGRKVKVGALRGEHAWLAGIHEYGVTIHPRKQYLTIPVSKSAIGKKARDFDDLFFVQAKSGEKFLARDKSKGEIELMFWLTRSVTIPERSFLRSGHDENIDRVMSQTERALKKVVDGSISIDDLLDVYGQQMSTAIKKKIRDINSPPNADVTKENKGSSNPLIDSGGLLESITWEVD